jgi:hypothetical protein
VGQPLANSTNLSLPDREHLIDLLTGPTQPGQSIGYSQPLLRGPLQGGRVTPGKRCGILGAATSSDVSFLSDKNALSQPSSDALGAASLLEQLSLTNDVLASTHSLRLWQKVTIAAPLTKR